MFKKVLIANRGEIAIRIQRACAELGIATVAVHSTADAHALHVRRADESICIGPPSARDSYLNMTAVLTAAKATGADAIHPGYGLLSENAQVAERRKQSAYPSSADSGQHSHHGATRSRARNHGGLGVPLVPGSAGTVADLSAARAAAGKIGYPRSRQGGGRRWRRGMKSCGERRDAR